MDEDEEEVRKINEQLESIVRAPGQEEPSFKDGGTSGFEQAALPAESISFQEIFKENFNPVELNGDLGIIEDDYIYEYSSDAADGNEPLSPHCSAEGHSPSDPDSPKALQEYEEIIPDEENIMEAIDDNDDEVPITYDNVKALNENYLISLHDFLDNLFYTLQENRARQREIGEAIQALEDTASQDFRGRDSLNKIKIDTIINRKTITIFGAPYFKDVRMFSHPDNEDTAQKKRCGEPDVYATVPPKWLKSDKDKLKNAVLEDSIHKRLTPYLEEENDLKGIINNNKILPEEKNKSIKSRLHILSQKIQEIKGLTEVELFSDPSEEFDWLKIATQTFKGIVSHKCIRLMWKNLVHPYINKSSWSKDEDDILKKLAKEYENKNWDNVSKESGNNRTPFLCFVRYQRKHRIAEFANRKWSQDEDHRLKSLVEQCRVNDFIPWNKVSYYMPNNRSKDMCYHRYTYSLKSDISKGTFSDEEDFLIIVGNSVFENQWTKIVKFIPYRTIVQISSRFHYFIKENFEPWTPQEDCLLLQTVQAIGIKDWKKVSSQIEGRSRTQCRIRFLSIYKNYRKDPKNFNLEESIKYTESSSTKQKDRQDALYEKLDARLRAFLEEEEQVVEDDGSVPKEYLLKFMVLISDKLSLESSVSSSRVRHLNAEELGILCGKKFAEANQSNQTKKHKILLPSFIREMKIRKGYEEYFLESGCDKAGRHRVRYRNKNYETLDDLCSGLWGALQCEGNLDLGQINQTEIKSLNEMDRQLVDIIQKCSKKGLNDRAQIVSEPPRKIIRTYGRKNKTQPRPVQELPSSTYLPPNLATTIGLKNMLLNIRKLMASIESKPKISRQCRHFTNKTLSQGIFNDEVAMSKMLYTRADSSSQDANLKKADKLLSDRFEALFFWPALLSVTLPNEHHTDHEIQGNTSKDETPNPNTFKRKANETFQ